MGYRLRLGAWTALDVKIGGLYQNVRASAVLPTGYHGDLPCVTVAPLRRADPETLLGRPPGPSPGLLQGSPPSRLPALRCSFVCFELPLNGVGFTFCLPTPLTTPFLKVWRFQSFCIILPTLGFVFLFSFSHSSGYEVADHCYFCLHFPDD